MFGWCMWQFMHCAVGMARVKACRRGWPFCLTGSSCSPGCFTAPWPCSCPCPSSASSVSAAIVGVDHVAARAARMAIVARLVVGAHEPHERIVEPGLVDVEDRDRHAQPGARPPVRLLEVGPARLLEPLDRAGRVGKADFGEL